MGMDPLTIGLIGAALTTGATVYTSQKQASQQSSAQKQAQANADKTASEADQANNKANQKSPDTSALLSAAAQSGKAGASGTMLTGPQGVDPNALSLGKNTLLGG